MPTPLKDSVSLTAASLQSQAYKRCVYVVSPLSPHPAPKFPTPGTQVSSGVLMVRQLKSWHENLGKRQVKASKVYVRDSGLLHALLGIRTTRDLLNHPKMGASWEGYAIEEVLKAVRPDDAYYWATYQGAELDLLLFVNGKRIGIEIKRTDAPTMTPSMRSALHDLKLDRLFVAYPGTHTYAIGDKTAAMPLSQLLLGGSDLLLTAKL